MNPRSRMRRITESSEAQRLLWIISTLSRGRPLSAKELVERFSISRPTVWRDLKRLEDLGYPILRESSNGGTVCRFPDGWPEREATLRLAARDLRTLLLAVKGALAKRRAPRWLGLLQQKLEILYQSIAPEPQIRLWQRIAGREQAPARPAAHSGSFVMELTAAAVECRWCELDYLSLGATEPHPLRFAPCEVRPPRVYGFVEGIRRWESLDLSRIRSVRVTQEQFEGGPAPFLGEDQTGQESQSETLERVEQQVLRLIGVLRRLDRGEPVSPARLAQVFSTTLNTVRRDLDLLGSADFGIAETQVAGRKPRYFLAGEISPGGTPCIPLSPKERNLLASVLEESLLYQDDPAVRRGLRWLKARQPEVSVTLTLEEPGAGGAPRETDNFWALVEAIASGQERVIWYTAHHRIVTRLQFIPERFVFDIPLLVRGTLLPDGVRRDLLFPAIFAVEMPAARTARLLEKK